MLPSILDVDAHDICSLVTILHGDSVATFTLTPKAIEPFFRAEQSDPRLHVSPPANQPPSLREESEGPIPLPQAEMELPDHAWLQFSAHSSGHGRIAPHCCAWFERRGFADAIAAGPTKSGGVTAHLQAP
jgi:hypothetical protein